jgi:predicted metalloprotease with PDZ domain
VANLHGSGNSLAESGLNKTKNRFGVYDGEWTTALCLDLELRAEAGQHDSLDDLMRLIWRR